MSRIAPLLAALIALSLALQACGGDDDDGVQTATTPGTAGCAEADPPPVKDVVFEEPEDTLDEGQDARVRMETNCGEFVIELATDDAPETTNSFAFLVDEGFYDNTVFHRIADGFVIQGGDPAGSGDQPGLGGPGYQIEEAPPEDLVYSVGVVAMAKAGPEPPGTSGSQFFVVTGPAGGQLEADFALIGEIVEGQEVVDRIGRLGGPDETPTDTVVVERATLER